MSDKKKNLPVIIDSKETELGINVSNSLPDNNAIENDLKDVSIGGNFIGGNVRNNYSFSLDPMIEEERKAKVIEKLADHTAKLIPTVASNIADGFEGELDDTGLDYVELNNKFTNMKCSPTLKSAFDIHATHFPNIVRIRETDAVKGGSQTINKIMIQIRHIYLNLVSVLNNGNEIYSRIYTEILKDEFTDEECYTTEILISYAIQECGIFNEKK